MAAIQDGRAALEQVAPALAAVLTDLESAMWRAMIEPGHVDLVDLAARVAAAQHGLEPLRRPTGLGPSPWAGVNASAWRTLEGLTASDDVARAALGFAEQMSFDVASIQVADRSALFAALGGSAPVFVQCVYVADFVPRARDALDAVFGDSDWAVGSGAVGKEADLQAAFDALIRQVPGLQAVDPITTEVVRVLGARRHQCRLCQSLRSRSALVAGADDDVFAAVDDYATSDLSESRKAALAFAEAMIGVPGRVGGARAEALLRHFEPEACVEIVLDVMRNATNKVAVALAADAPNVDSGYEVYDVGPDGELHFGLDAP